MDILIRQEHPSDTKSITEVVRIAFLNEEHSDKLEHHLVNKIRESDAFIPELSLIALDKRNNEIVGHILLSKITIVDDKKAINSLALAPVSVTPQRQNGGIGTLLIQSALKKAEEVGFQSVIVLGHQNYYPKFGFKRASLWKVQAPFEVPDENFMAIELTKDALSHVQGTVHYSKAFSE
ncbi:N-acetyltransferase [Bacillus sp. JCM 19041]|uniref:GNAT family N-acetyltransferase n=1 Tax=Bacillus sp. JCM 19041 TaxID=1460637 RepID=UPI0006D0712C